MPYESTRIYSARPNDSTHDVTTSGSGEEWVARQGQVINNLPGGTTKNSVGGGRPWNDTGNIDLNDDQLATADNLSTAGDPNTQELQVTNWNLTIPPGATILGIDVQVEKHKLSGTPEDDVVRLLGGADPGDNKAQPGVWPQAVNTTVYGEDSYDLWGNDWSRADIHQNASFGVAFAAKTADEDSEVGIDYIRLRVYYATTNGLDLTEVIRYFDYGGVNIPNGTTRGPTVGQHAFAKLGPSQSTKLIRIPIANRHTDIVDGDDIVGHELFIEARAAAGTGGAAADGCVVEDVRFGHDSTPVTDPRDSTFEIERDINRVVIGEDVNDGWGVGKLLTRAQWNSGDAWVEFRVTNNSQADRYVAVDNVEMVAHTQSEELVASIHFTSGSTGILPFNVCMDVATSNFGASNPAACDIRWFLVEAPQEYSPPSLANPLPGYGSETVTQATHSFGPVFHMLADVEGEYRVVVVIRDKDGNQSAAEKTFTVNSDPRGTPTVIHDEGTLQGNLASDTKVLIDAGATVTGDVTANNLPNLWIKGASPTNRPIIKNSDPTRGIGLIFNSCNNLIIEDVIIDGLVDDDIETTTIATVDAQHPRTTFTVNGTANLSTANRVLFSGGDNDGQVRRVTAFDPTTRQVTVAGALPFDAEVGKGVQFLRVKDGITLTNCDAVCLKNVGFTNVFSANENGGGLPPNDNTTRNATYIDLRADFIDRYGIGYFSGNRHVYIWAPVMGKIRDAEGCIRLDSIGLAQHASDLGAVLWGVFTNEGGEAGIRNGFTLSLVYGCHFDMTGCGVGSEPTDWNVRGCHSQRLECSRFRNGTADNAHGLRAGFFIGSLWKSDETTLYNNGQNSATCIESGSKGPSRGIHILHNTIDGRVHLRGAHPRPRGQSAVDAPARRAGRRLGLHHRHRRGQRRPLDRRPLLHL